MKIELWVIGKTNENYLKKGCEIYSRRILHYTRFETLVFKNLPIKSGEELKLKEGEMVMDKLDNSDYFILLDEIGESIDSVQFADKIQQWMNQSRRRVVFLIAGAYGAADTLKTRADLILSLSKMTFSHQMIRLFFLEQLYRAFTIIKNEKYHNP